MKSFLISIGHLPGASLPTLISALSCGAALPVGDLDILQLDDRDADPVLPSMVRDLNLAHTVFDREGNLSLFPSSFRFDAFRPALPTLQELAKDPAADALLGALRGKGLPLSWKTDREAVEWAFAFLLSEESFLSADPFRSWAGRIRACITDGQPCRVALLCDLSDAFSSGAAFSLLRWLSQNLRVPPASLALFCLAESTDSASAKGWPSALRALEAENLTGRPDMPGTACADAVWLFSLPGTPTDTEDSGRILYAVLARHLARFWASEKEPAAGLHTASLPGILTLQSLGDQAKPFSAFMLSSVWLLSDLLPAFRAYCDHPSALLSRTPNTRNSLFRRLHRGGSPVPEESEQCRLVQRALTAVLSQILSLIQSLPAPFRLASVSDPLWQKVVEACGRVVTVSSEYDVSGDEAREAGLLNIKPVHRVSLADTEEEKLARRLDDINAQLAAELESRDRLFVSVGRCWSVLALRDCRTRCRQALAHARQQQEEAGEENRQNAVALARRIRLLEAAVSRCDRDLSDEELFRRIDSGTPDALPGLTPFSSELLDPAAAGKLASLLAADTSDPEALRREILTLFPSLLYGFRVSDSKKLVRRLIAECEPEEGSAPLSRIGLTALDLCRAEAEPLRFLSDGQLPEIPLLPDLALPVRSLTVSSLLPYLPSPGTDDSAEKRGLLAMLLLRPYRRGNAEEALLSTERLNPENSPVLRSFLASRKADGAFVLSLKKSGEQLPFALILPGCDLLPARLSAGHDGLVSSFASPWFDEENHAFRDPCALLGEGDLAILLDRLSALTAEPVSAGFTEGFSAFLHAFLEDLRLRKEHPSLPSDLDLRLRSAYGLRLLPAFRTSLVRRICSYEANLPSDTVAAALAGLPTFPSFSGSLPDEVLFLYRDVPFARENSQTLLDAIPLPAESYILGLLDSECRTLSRGSDDYHDHLVREISLLLERSPDALPEARDAALSLLEKAGEPVTDPEVSLTWPWDPKSPSVITLLTESFGESIAEAMARPFSDLLTVFPARSGEVIGDSLMSAMCVLPPAGKPEEGSVPDDAVLPPLSPELCSLLCRLPEGRTLFRPGMMSFERQENGSVRVTFTPEGNFTLRLLRTYTEDEILCLYSHDIPTLAVWPNLPLNPEDWHAYYIYASMPEGLSLTAHSGGETLSAPDSVSGRLVLRASGFPSSFSFYRGNQSMGAVPNLLPAPEILKSERFTACVDFGSVGTSVVFSAGHRRQPLRGASLVRTLINNPAASRELLRKEFLPAVPVSALLPTASRIFRNVPGAAPEPFSDGIVLMSSDLQDVLSIPSGALYTCLKWEEDKGRSVSLCLHQIMLMAALQARTDGASSLTWRFAVPDEMARTGRENLIRLFTSLAEEVSAESGFVPPQDQPLVTFASESSALGAYFRLCATEDTRGGFMVLDLGACTADISLFLRGREQAVRTCQLPLGIHYMLLPLLLREPDLLTRELGMIQDPAFLHDLSLLEQVLRSAKADPSALRHSRLALDHFLADRYPSVLPCLLQNPVTGRPSRTGSVLLLHLSYLMMLSGLILLQIAADPGKNDFLPEQMSLCLSGRGSLIPEALPDPYKTSLWHFLTMFRNRRVASLSLLFSSEKKMEIPVGLSALQEVSPSLPAAAAVPAAIPVRPEELLPQFILRFAKEFPASAEELFPGFFTGDFYHPFTPWGEAQITEAISRSFTESTALRPFDALSAWITTLLELLSSRPE